MFISTLFLTCILSLPLPLALTTPSDASSYFVKQEIPSPEGWTITGPPDPNHTITLYIALRQPRAHLVEDFLNEISDPRNERYGMYMSKQEVHDILRPHPEAVDAVDSWLRSLGLAERDIRRSTAQDRLILTISIAKAEKILQTTYSIWTHASSGDSLIRSLRFSIPRNLHTHIELIQPTTAFIRMNGLRSTISVESKERDASLGPELEARETIPSICSLSPTIPCIRQLYNVGNYKASPATQSSIGITGFLEQRPSESDLELFYDDQNITASSTINIVPLDDANARLSAGSEANLDVQYAAGLTYPIPLTFWYTEGRPPFDSGPRTMLNTNEPYMEWLTYIMDQDDIPLVISSSYGDDEHTVPEDYARHVCLGFALLSLRGVSIIASSGDYGVGDDDPSPASHKCYTNDGTRKHSFIPTFPASCPYVTAVGGTQSVNPEVALTRFPSGGGFSHYFKRPSYQRTAVSSYLDALPEGLYEGLYNRGGRGFPDVSAQGDYFKTYLRGNIRMTGGTSASAPVFAALIALLNDARLENGQPALGFLNPHIYSKGVEGFNDILIGSNPGCGTAGFNVTKGWDPVTGLGTPNFGKLAEIFVDGWNTAHEDD